MIRVALAFMLISASAFAQTSVQGTPQDKNLFDSEPSSFISNIPQEVPGQQFPISQVVACAALTPSGKCVQIKVDEEGRVIAALDEKSDTDKKCPDTFREWAEGYTKGYIKALEDQREAK